MMSIGSATARPSTCSSRSPGASDPSRGWGWPVAAPGRSRWRAWCREGQVATIGRDALALDLGETHAVVGAAGAAMSVDEIAELHERTEGWATGALSLALAARNRTGESDAPTRIPDSSDRLVEEYVRSEILARTSPEDADLLLHASVLERISGPLCDAVLERTGSGTALDRLERANLFLIPLDRGRTWFRFHHVLADLLRAELERRDPDAARRTRRRAASWHDAQGLLRARPRIRDGRVRPRSGRAPAGPGQPGHVQRGPR